MTALPTDIPPVLPLPAQPGTPLCSPRTGGVVWARHAEIMVDRLARTTYLRLEAGASLASVRTWLGRREVRLVYGTPAVSAVRTLLFGGAS